MEKLISILNWVCLVFGILTYAGCRIFSGIKSGCFYQAHRRAPESHRLLKRFYPNIHFIETPYWRLMFFGFDAILIFAFNHVHPELGHIWKNVCGAILVSHGASAFAGVFYQGFINVGNVTRDNVPLKFVDENENPRMEWANPSTQKTRWLFRPWYGKRRIYASVGGVFMMVGGIILVFVL